MHRVDNGVKENKMKKINNINKKNKWKKQRFVILIISLVVLVFISVKALNKNNNSEAVEGPQKTEEEPKKIEQEDTKEKDAIVGINVSPSIYRAYTGEIIDVNKFKVNLEYQSGESKVIDVNEDIVFIIVEENILKIEDYSIIISNHALTADEEIITVMYKEFKDEINIKVFNSLEDNLDADDTITNPSSYDVVVNKSRNLLSTYVPDDLVSVNELPTSLQNPEVNQLRKVAFEALKDLFLHAQEEKSLKLYARSGYRSYNTQKSLYSSYVRNNGQEAADKFSAKPGQSEHQTGLAMDITCEAMNYKLDDTFGETEEGKWVMENAHRFGFVIRYPKGKEEITGYQYEPWHLRYVGLSLSKEIHEKNITLEEYFE